MRVDAPGRGLYLRAEPGSGLTRREVIAAGAATGAALALGDRIATAGARGAATQAIDFSG